MAPPPRRKKEPVLLKPLQLAGTIAILPIVTALFVVGVLGVVVLMDTEGKNPLTGTQFGSLYRAMVQRNPFYAAFIMNGGMLGTLVFGTFLIEHFQARKKAKAAAAAAAAGGTAAVTEGAGTESEGKEAEETKKEK